MGTPWALAYLSRKWPGNIESAAFTRLVGLLREPAETVIRADRKGILTASSSLHFLFPAGCHSMSHGSRTHSVDT